MKTTMLTSILSVLLLISCTTKTSDITPTTSWLTTDTNQPTATITTDLVKLYANDTWVTIGDTTIPKKTVTLHPINATAPDLSALKNTIDNDLKGKPLRMVSIGGSLTAGMQNGGLYQESQLTSYPNLIARQMQLVSFIQPLFTNKEYNGYGYKLPTSSNTPVPKFNAVKNNTAVESIDARGNVTLNPYTGGNVDNFAVPYLDISSNLNSKIDNGSSSFSQIFPAYLTRILDKNSTIYSKIQGQKFDILLIDGGVDALLTESLRGVAGAFGNLGMVSDNQIQWITLIKQISSFGGITFMNNIPDVLDYPYFNIVTLDKLKSNIGTNLIYYRISNGKDAWLVDNTFMFVPNQTLDSLLNPNIKVGKKGFTKSLPLENKDLLDIDEINNIRGTTKLLNDFIISKSKTYNFVIVDLYTLYKNISNGNYSSDGIKINSSNFFSSDGINPTALGQAVIANEFIKTMNTFYKTNIPLINVSYYQK